MCLSTITSRRTGTNLQETTVWKEFRISKLHECPTCSSFVEVDDPKLWVLKNGQVRDDVWTDDKTGVWVKAEGRRLGYESWRSYPQGFHGYADKAAYYVENDHIIIPVKFRRIHTVGTQYNRKVLVAYEMMIPKNWRKYIR
jgi:hypothetical protein